MYTRHPLFAFLFFLLFLLNSSVVMAGPPPGGSYIASCRGARLEGTTLRASCKGQSMWVEAMLLDVGSCRGDIMNQGGALRCNRQSASAGARPPIRSIGKRRAVDAVATLPPANMRHFTVHRLFHGGSVSCSSMQKAADSANQVGWGQVEWYGAPCSADVYQLAVYFDFANAPPLRQGARINRAVLEYDEYPGDSDGRGCSQVFGYNYIPCWSNGNGDKVDKPDGCVVVKVPGIDWRIPTVKGQVPTISLIRDPRKLGPGRWDVTEIVSRQIAGEELGSTLHPFGMLLTGPLLINQLTGEDSTNCTSVVKNVHVTIELSNPPPPTLPPTILK